MRIDHVGVLALVVGLFGGNVEAGQEGTDMKLEDMGFISAPRTHQNKWSACVYCQRASL
jgi:hypothetical protein